MTRAKKATKNRPGRDAKGNPIPLQSISAAGANSSDRQELAQRRGDGLKGAMEKEHERK